MTAARRIRRCAVVGLAVVGAAVLLLRTGVGIYLDTARGRGALAGQIGSKIGLPVEVGDVALGSNSSTITFRVLDPPLGNRPNAEIFSVDSATADVSFVDVVTGRAYPKELHLRGVRLTLRLDATGKLLTSLPTQPISIGQGEISSITVDSGQVTIQQDGRPEFHLSGLNLKAARVANTFILSGSADDPVWGKWHLSGEFEATAKTGWIDLATADTLVTTERLKSIPYLSLSLWENAWPSGRVQATAHFAVGPNNDLKYDIRMQAERLALGIPAAEVTLTDVAGVLRIHEGLVEIYGIEGKPVARGNLAGGTVAVSARWDCREDPAIGEPLVVSVDRLVVKDLPANWRIKSVGGLNMEDGFLSGIAKIRLVTYNDGRIETYGNGQGIIDLPHIFGGQGKLEVDLGGNGHRLNINLAGAAAPIPRAAPN
jgi:hypothetical protein